MINEEVTGKFISLQIQASRMSYELMKQELEKLLKFLEQHGGLEKTIQNHGNQVKLKDLVKKGQLEEIPIKDEDFKELKKQLNRYGVKFSTMKDYQSNQYSVFFQAKDAKIMEVAFKNALLNTEKKAERKESISKAIQKLKEMAKDTISKDRVKNKQQEQSL